MAMLKPRMAVLDETDSGLDIDALKVVAGGVNELVGPSMGALVITHYKRILNYIQPDHVHVFVDGRIVESGGPELADKLEESGYEEWGVSTNGSAADRRGRLMAQIEDDSEWQARRERDRPRDRLRLRGQVRLPQLATRPRTTSSSPGRGLSHELVEMISEHKNEPDWMRKFRHNSLDYFNARPLPTWGGDVSGIDFENIYYYIKPTEKQADSWEDLPADIKDTWDKLGHPRGREEEARRGRRRPVRVRGRLPQDPGAASTKQGVIFLDMDSGLREHEELVKQYFGTIIPLERQQVRRAEQRRLVGRLVHLRPEGRQDRAAAPGLLPDQRREHGPVRAHADHRRRGRLRALRRGLHRADLLERLAALARSSRSSSRRAAAAATRRSRTGRTTSTTSSPSARSPTRTRRWSGSTGTSARS